MDFNFKEYFSSTAVMLVEKIILTVVVLVIAKVGMSVMKKFVKKILNKSNSFSDRKKATLESILESIIEYVIKFLAIFTILNQVFGVASASIIAIFSVFSVAIGLGAQNFVKDIVTGFLFVLEDQFGVGDFVSFGAYSGVVENMGLRTTSLRSTEGFLYIVPNSSISIVTNMNKGFLRVVLDISVAYSNDADTVINVLKDEMESVYKNLDGLRTKPEVLGINKMGGGSFEIRIVADCETDKKESIERSLRIAIKERFGKEEIV